jgi:hypothetical protein
MWNALFTSADQKQKQKTHLFFNNLNRDSSLIRQKIADPLLFTQKEWNEIVFVYFYLTKGNCFKNLHSLIARFLETKILATSQILNTNAEYLIHRIHISKSNQTYEFYVKFTCTGANDGLNEMFYDIIRTWKLVNSDNQPPERKISQQVQYFLLFFPDVCFYSFFFLLQKEKAILVFFILCFGFL